MMSIFMVVVLENRVGWFGGFADQAKHVLDVAQASSIHIVIHALEGDNVPEQELDALGHRDRSPLEDFVGHVPCCFV